MASKSSKLPPEDLSAAVNDPATKRAHVHLVPVNGAWEVRLGRRTERTFPTHFDAAMAAIPFARERGSRLFVHYEGGEIREAGTALTDELMLEMWKMVYDDYNQRVDRRMASKRPKLPPEPAADPPKPRVEHVHVAPGEHGWVMRVGRRMEAHFDSPDEALDVAVPLARKRSARVFLHLRSGERREMSTGEAEELLYQFWKDLHAQGMLPIYE